MFNLSKCLPLCCIFLLAACSSPEPPAVNLENQPQEVVWHGEKIVVGLGACGFCHGSDGTPSSPLSGGLVWANDRGAFRATNLTPSRSGVGELSDREIITRLRTDKTGSGRRLLSKAHPGMEWISDPDIYAVVAYLRTLTPIDSSVVRQPASFEQELIDSLLGTSKDGIDFVPAVRKPTMLLRGEYLVDHVARCVQCHNTPSDLLNSEKYLEGGRQIMRGEQVRYAPDITAARDTGIGGWKVDDVVVYLQTGRSPSGEIRDSNFCPTEFYKSASPEDLRAIATYLLTNQ